MKQTSEPRFHLTALLTLALVFLSSAASAANFDPFLAMPGHGGETEDAIWYRLVKYAGKFHVLVIHFPIAFLLGACLAQWWSILKGSGSQAASTMLWLGMAGAVVAVALGWAYAYDSAYFGDSEKLLFWHRWLGTSTAVAALTILVFRRKFGKKSLAWILTILALLVTVAGHLGGSLVRGADFLLKF